MTAIQTLNFDEDLNIDQARSLKKVLTELIDSEGWAFLERFIANRVEGRQRELMQVAPETIEQMSRYNKIFGGVQELQMLPEMVKQLTFNLGEQVERLLEEEAEAATVAEAGTITDDLNDTLGKGN